MIETRETYRDDFVVPIFFLFQIIRNSLILRSMRFKTFTTYFKLMWFFYRYLSSRLQEQQFEIASEKSEKKTHLQQLVCENYLKVRINNTINNGTHTFPAPPPLMLCAYIFLVVPIGLIVRLFVGAGFLLPAHPLPEHLVLIRTLVRDDAPHMAFLHVALLHHVLDNVGHHLRRQRSLHRPVHLINPGRARPSAERTGGQRFAREQHLQQLARTELVAVPSDRFQGTLRHQRVVAAERDLL